MSAVLPPIAAPREDLCLDFANTLCWRGRAAPAESLSGLADLRLWLAGPAGVSAPLVAAAEEWARRDADRGAELFAAAIALREAIYRIFAAASAGEPALEADLALLNDGLAAAPPRSRLVRAGGGYAWAAGRSGVAAAALLAPVLWSAADLLAGIAHRRVRRCANEECLWLFVDHSKGGTRRWCDMGSCGNRAKSRRHYLRTKPPGKRSSG